jgi:hypothetical protein
LTIYVVTVKNRVHFTTAVRVKTTDRVYHATLSVVLTLTVVEYLVEYLTGNKGYNSY